jgi:hypothetical protein
VVRIRNVTSNGFEMRIQEWDCQDGVHGLESVSYLVVEKGSYILENGARLEAGRFEADGSDKFVAATFGHRFSAAPVVISTVVTEHGPEAVAGRVKKVKEDQFKYKLQEQQANAADHVAEMVAYVAWEPSAGKVGEHAYLVGATANEVKHTLQTVFLDTSFAGNSVFLADMQTTDGGDPASVRWLNFDGAAVDLYIAEEQSADEEIGHTTETVGFMVIEMKP